MMDAYMASSVPKIFKSSIFWFESNRNGISLHMMMSFIPMVLNNKTSNTKFLQIKRSKQFAHTLNNNTRSFNDPPLVNKISPNYSKGESFS